MTVPAESRSRAECRITSGPQRAPDPREADAAWKPDGSFACRRRRPTSAPRSTPSRSRSVPISKCRPTVTKPRPRRIPRSTRSASAGGQGRLCVRSRFPGGAASASRPQTAGRRAARGARPAGSQRPRGEGRHIPRRDRARRPRRQRGRRALRRRGRCGRTPGRCACRSPASSRSSCGSPTARRRPSSARRLLPEQVPFDDAVFNVGRTALLVAALAAGAVDALPRRDRRPPAPGLAGSLGHATPRMAIDAMLDAGAFGSLALGLGSVGRGVRRPRRRRRGRGGTPPPGRTLVLEIDDEGAVVT